MVMETLLVGTLFLALGVVAGIYVKHPHGMLVLTGLLTFIGAAGLGYSFADPRPLVVGASLLFVLAAGQEFLRRVIHLVATVDNAHAQPVERQAADHDDRGPSH